MQNLLKTFTIVLLLGVFTISCVKTEGVGGAAKITGKVIKDDYNSFGTFIASFPAQDERVYIIYGDDNNIISDNVRTSYDGSFEFNYLKKGNYKIFVYSKCVTCANGEDSVATRQIKINEKNEVVNLTDIIIRD